MTFFFSLSLLPSFLPFSWFSFPILFLSLSLLSIEWEHTHNYGRACMFTFDSVHACIGEGKSMTDYHLRLQRNEWMNERDWIGNYRPWTNWKKRNHLTGTLNTTHWRSEINPSAFVMFISLLSIYTIRLCKDTKVLFYHTPFKQMNC